MKHLHLFLALLLPQVAAAQPGEAPTSTDPRIEVTRFAGIPDLVHPISIDFDAKGRLLVIESHTHFPPGGYKGPKHDRIRLLEDTDGDGKADRFTTFHEGCVMTMDLAVHPDGSVYVATRREVFRLRDKDGDGIADERTTLVKMDSPGDYPHNGLCGLCFDASGDVYFGMGENLGAKYTLMGVDGATHSDQKEGGNVFWCTKDGRKLRRVATGFWNPFGICRDANFNFFAVDNDPDARPPCRLLHLVEGADFGYQLRYGRSGRHPFQAWNGEVPGTLPMVSGTGEAPCEVLVYQGKGLPAEYVGDLFVTSWGDHRVERYRATPKGASFTAERQPFIKGGSEFRPVGLAIAPDGSLFFSDWVRKDYTLHGQGAIWRARVRKGVAIEPATTPAWTVAQRERLAALQTQSESKKRVGAFLSKAEPPLIRAAAAGMLLEEEIDLLRPLLRSDDPFVRHAAVQRLARSTKGDAFFQAGADPADRLARLLVARAAGRPFDPAFLKDGDDDVRFLAARWISDQRLAGMRAAVAQALKDPTLNSRLFHALATALARIDDQEVNEESLARFFLKRANDSSTPVEQRVQALRMVPATFKELTPARLKDWLGSDERAFRLEAVRALAEHPPAVRVEALSKLASDPSSDARLRAEALVGVADQPPIPLLLKGAADASPVVADEALRALVGATLTDAEVASLVKAARPGPLLDRVLRKPFAQKRPPVGDGDAWLKLLDGPADADAGRRIFFHPRLAGCFRCHKVDGRGRDLGPDLSTIGQRERRLVLQSILQPSELVAPHYQAWQVETADGKVRNGLLVGTRYDDLSYVDDQGTLFTVNSRDVAATRALRHSIMPDGLVDRLTDQEIRDLLAFLGTRR